VSGVARESYCVGDIATKQYLSDAKNPHGYCGIGGTGVSCPAGLTSTETG
jgi:hypothetical protein